MTFDLIIFDCDGTLVDSEYLNCVSTSEVIIDAGLPRYSVDVIYAEMVGMSLDNIYKKIEAESNITLPPDMTQRIIDRVDANAEELMKRIEGARDTVAWAADKYTMCVASPNKKDKAQVKPAESQVSKAGRGLEQEYEKEYRRERRKHLTEYSSVIGIPPDQKDEYNE
jgi:phosphoglycolate phosphatase-like HAD superfamily hydrolase